MIGGGRQKGRLVAAVVEQFVRIGVEPVLVEAGAKVVSTE
jgi:hypothetical protein